MASFKATRSFTRHHHNGMVDKVPEKMQTTTSKAITLKDLENFANYSIQVLAYTKSGDGPLSEVVFCKTLDDVPDPVMDIKGAVASEDSVVVSWKPPEKLNGILKSYSIYWKDSSNEKLEVIREIPPQQRHHEVRPLQDGHQYDFWVTASTLAGEGKSSRIIRQAINGPKVPAKVLSFDDKVHTPWKKDVVLECYAVGSPELTRVWNMKGKELKSSGKTKILAEGSLSIKGIDVDDGGDYSCEVQNELGSDRITYTVIVVAPPSPPVIESVSTSTSEIQIQWKVTTSKLAKFKGFILHVRKEAGTWKEISLKENLRIHRLDNLECGTRYEIYMSAFNKIGTGIPSEVHQVSTNGSVPDPPSKSDLIEEASNSVSLYLNTWKSNGCPILYYNVEYAPKFSKEFTLVSNKLKPHQKRLVIPGLASGTWYSLRMTAHNTAGSSVAEYEFATLTPSGATITPILMDKEGIKGFIGYLNLYIIMPVMITAVTLLAILATACFYVKMKKGRNGQVFSTTENDQNTKNYSTLQNSTLLRDHFPPTIPEENLDDPSPYAMCHLSTCPPPLPPPNMMIMPQALPFSHQAVFNGYSEQAVEFPSAFLPPPPRNILLGHDVIEATFVMPPSNPKDETCAAHIQPTYTNDVDKAAI